MDSKYVRKDSQTEDKGSSDAIEYNLAAGAKKVVPVGHHLRPITQDGTTFSTNMTSATKIGGGKTLAVYNNSGTVGSITFGKDSTVTANAVGAVTASGSDFIVGHACPPNTWIYFNAYTRPWAIASAGTLLCYLVEDTTYVTDQNNVTQI